MNRQLATIINQEFERQEATLSLIPSENYVSPAVQAAQGSILTNKYAEGYPGKRYYAGTTNCDRIEQLAHSLAQKLFQTDYLVNVQPYSGSPANLAVYLALLQPGEKIMGLNLPAGGHLSHGHKVSLTGQLFQSVPYDVKARTGLISYAAVRKLARRERPSLIIAGTTAYARSLDFSHFGAIAKTVGAYFLADISHISGLVATGLHPTPFGWADVVTTTTHKLLRGPRGAIIFSRTEEIAKKVNQLIFPGLQGGPHLQTIAAIAQCLNEARTPAYHRYCRQVVKNAQAMVAVFLRHRFKVVSGGTETHLWLIDLRSKNLDGQTAQDSLEQYGIIVNKNTIPHDPASPFRPSGIRLGTPALTTRGLKEKECRWLATVICQILDGQKVRPAVLKAFTARFPIPSVNNLG